MVLIPGAHVDPVGVQTQFGLCESHQQCHGLVRDGLCLSWPQFILMFTTQVPQAFGVEGKMTH